MKTSRFCVVLPLGRALRTGLRATSSLLWGWVFVLALGIPSLQAASSPPDLMTYQGFLVDGNGNPLATNAPANYPVIFRIYSGSSGGTGRLWSEQQIATVDKGVFSVVLGEGTPVSGEAKPALSSIFSGATASDRYMSISVTIGGSTLEILPRLRLLPSPYSFLATSASSLIQPNGSSVINYANNRVEAAGPFYSAGSITTGDRIGVGTTGTPVASLEVRSGGVAVTGSSSPYGGRGVYLEGQAALGSVFAYNYNSAQPMPLILNSPGGNIGINTTTPGFPLTFPNSLGDKVSLWGQSGDSFGFGVAPSTLQIHVDLAGSDIAFGYGRSATMTDLMRIKGNGNVGVGVNPARRFHVSGTDTVMGRFDSSSTIGTWLSLGNSSVGGRYWQFISSGSGNGEGAGKLLIGDGASDGSTSIRMTLQDNGNVGIGVTSPAFRLHVQDPGAQTGRIHVGGTSANGDPKLVTFGDGALVSVGENGADDTLELRGGRVSVVGSMGLGTATPSDRLHLRGGILRIDDGGSRYIQMYRSVNGFIIAGNSMSQQGGGNGTIQWDGDGNWDSLSDRRLKKDITDAESVLERTMQLPVRRYRWKDAAEDAPKKFGVIAQEVQPLFPEAVGSMTRPGASEESFTVKYGSFGLIAIKALQELKVEKDAEQVALKREVDELRQEVAQLKGRLSKVARVEALEGELNAMKEIVQRLASRTDLKPGVLQTGAIAPGPTGLVTAQSETVAAR